MAATALNAQRDELLKVFHCGLDELEANRAGRLGAGQAHRLIRSGNLNVVAALVLGAGLAAILFGVAKKPLVPVQWLLSSGLFLAALAVGIHYARQTRAAAAAGIVECLAGPVQVQLRGKQGWWLSVAGQSLKLPIRGWHVQSGASYRVYLVPRGRLIVAIEPIGAADG